MPAHRTLTVVTASVVALTLVGGSVALVTLAKDEPARPKREVVVAAAPRAKKGVKDDGGPRELLKQSDGPRAPRIATEWIDAIAYDGKRGLDDGGNGIFLSSSHGYARFANVRFGPDASLNRLEVDAASTQRGGVLYLRAGSPEGPVLASMPLRRTGGPNVFLTHSAPVLSPLAGDQELFLTWNNAGIGTVKRFRFVAGPAVRAYQQSETRSDKWLGLFSRRPATQPATAPTRPPPAPDALP